MTVDVKQVSLLNFIRYNVAGGGESALYGTEGPLFYLRNGANNLNLVLALVLLAPLVAWAQWRRPGAGPAAHCPASAHAVAPACGKQPG